MPSINPVFRKELKLGARTVRFPVVLLIYNSILAFISLLTFYTILEGARQSGKMDYEGILLLYGVIIAIEGILLAFIIPALTASTISGERERQTLDILLTTRMTPVGIITGKLMSSMSMIILLVISSIPVISIIFLFGGVAFMDVLKIMGYLIFAAVFFGTIGIACSARFKKTTTSTVAAYSGVLGICLGTVMLVFIGALLGNVMPSVTVEAMVGVVGLILLINPGMTMVVILIKQLTYDGYLAKLLESFGIGDFMADHWVAASIVIQLMFILLLLWRAQAALRPKRY